MPSAITALGSAFLFLGEREEEIPVDYVGFKTNVFNTTPSPSLLLPGKYNLKIWEYIFLCDQRPQQFSFQNKIRTKEMQEISVETNITAKIKHPKDPSDEANLFSILKYYGFQNNLERIIQHVFVTPPNNLNRTFKQTPMINWLFPEEVNKLQNAFKEHPVFSHFHIDIDDVKFHCSKDEVITLLLSHYSLEQIQKSNPPLYNIIASHLQDKKID